ncbi:DUF3383 family protein, partial [Enterobacter hormaechei]
MPNGLSVQRVVSVQVSLAVRAAAGRNFGALLVLGTSSVITAPEVMRLYQSIESVATDFGTSAEEYKAANLYFQQSPQPRDLYIGKLTRTSVTASSGKLTGAVLSTAEKALSNFTAVTAGALKLSINGTVVTLTAINLSAVTDLAGVATAITAKMTGATVSWVAGSSQFVITSTTTGASSAIGIPTAAGTGTDLAPLLGIDSAHKPTVVNGQAASTSVVPSVNAALSYSADWYGLVIADTAMTDQDHLDVSALIGAASDSRVYGVSTAATAVLDSTSTTDIAYKLKAAGYGRTFCQYSLVPYAAASAFGRA